MPDLYNIPVNKDSPKIVNAVIEIPKGTSAKYEYDPELQLFRLDRCLLSAMTYPANYGFIPGTLGDDHDPLDIIVYNNTPIDRATLVECVVLGCLDMTDDGEKDYKILAAPISHSKKYTDIQHIDQDWLNVAANFFAHYKDLTHKHVVVDGWLDKSQAQDIIINSYT